MPEPTHYDKRGVPIYPGDLLKSFHFRDRRKNHYLYHVAVTTPHGLDVVPTAHLEPTKITGGGGGGRCRLSAAIAAEAEVISGYGPEPYLSHEDRPRKQREPVDA